jgi:tRNA nucleotidyltransferase (CCA-adding enzyme)
MSELNFTELINSTPDAVFEFALDIETLQGETWIVGGAVRDFLVGAQVHDFDLEVTGVSVETFLGMADWIISPAGDRFGVWLVSGLGETFEVALPQRRERFGPGHQDETAVIDTDLEISDSLSRRDFTMNAMAVQVLSGEFIDPFNGVDDLVAGTLRAVSTRNFADDPLRVLRGMQFAARFDLVADLLTAGSAFDNRGGFETLSPDRVRMEWVKWSKAEFPAAGIRFLRMCGWHQCFPILGDLDDLEQDPVWHPEGDVLQHTIDALEAAAPVNDPVVSFAVLLHDVGKVGTTDTNDAGRIVSPGHAEEGADLVVDFFRSAGWDIQTRVPDMVQAVQALVSQHMRHVSWDGAPSRRAVRRMAVDVSPATVRQWAQVCIADVSGRGNAGTQDSIDVIIQAAEVAGDMDIIDDGPEQIVMGRHLIDAGFRPGVQMGEIIRQAFNAQVDGAFDNVDDGMAWVQDNF